MVARISSEPRPSTGLEQALAVAQFAPGDVFELAAIVKGHGRSRLAARRFVVGAGSGAEDWIHERAREQAKLGPGACEGGIYLGLNPLISAEGGRAKDCDVRAVRMLLIDVDPVDASPAARAAAADMANEIRALLRARLDVAPALIDSGRGRQLWLAHEPMAPDDESWRATRAGVLAGLARRFDRELAKVDVKTFNASRLARLPGTVNLRTREHACRLCAAERT